MKYTIKSHPTRYKGVLFRSRLEARWAAFFDLAGWKWSYEPLDLPGWTPDFLVEFPCGHSECGGSHSLLVEVKPYLHVQSFSNHASMKYPYGRMWDSDSRIPADASASFGNDPSVSFWEFAHGAGGGVETIEEWVKDWKQLWIEAGNITQYRPNH